jgi:hypothetical protein
VVVGIGVLASIATSGISVERGESDLQRVPLYELDPARTETRRACVDWAFSDGPAAEPATFEVEATLNRPSPDASIPIEIELRDTSHRAEGVLNASTVRLALRVTVPADELSSVGCSPWIDIRLGPAEGELSRGSIEWRVVVAAEVLTSGISPPWDRGSYLRFEAPE